MLKTIVIVEVVVYASAAILVATQILLPALRGRPLFPLLRSKPRKIEGELALAREDADLAAARKVLETPEPAPSAAAPPAHRRSRR